MREIRKTKIVCTLGPSTDKGDVLRQLMQEGMNVARFNFSHGSHEEQKARLDKLVALREELDLPVAALLDTKGPEIRLKELKGGKAELKEGQLFTLALGDFVGDASRVAITYEDLHNDVKAGDRILIDDGLIEMKAPGNPKSYRVGDPVKVICVRADVNSGQIDFEPADNRV